MEDPRAIRVHLSIPEDKLFYDIAEALENEFGWTTVEVYGDEPTNYWITNEADDIVPAPKQVSARIQAIVQLVRARKAMWDAPEPE